MSEENKDQLCCSFCGKSQSEVKKLVAGRGVYSAAVDALRLVYDEIAEASIFARDHLCRIHNLCHNKNSFTL